MKQEGNAPLNDVGGQRRPYGGRPSLIEAERLHGRILDAAAELFTKHGYGETSIEAIAAHAGIGKLTLYRRFEDKDTLFQAVAIRLSEHLRAVISETGKDEDTLSDALTASGRRVLGVLLSPPSIAFYRILVAEAARLPELCARMYQEPPSEFQYSIRAIFLRFAERGVVRIDDVAFLGQQFTQAIIGKPLQNAVLGAPPMSAHAQEEHVRKTVDLFLRGAAISVQSQRIESKI